MKQVMRWTVTDLEVMPEPLDDTRYEIIDGELYVSHQPSWEHQYICMRLASELHGWSSRSGAGVANWAPGVIFAEDDAVAPDIVWVSKERLPSVLGTDGKLHAAPDLVVEVLSPGASNERRDREVKLGLYSRRGVQEYWMVSWQRREVAVYRRVQAQLQLAETLREDDHLRSPLLPGFFLSVRELFADLPAA
jgi:Uma2 family endonuclease